MKYKHRHFISTSSSGKAAAIKKTFPGLLDSVFQAIMSVKF
jgi:hypothetical protein